MDIIDPFDGSAISFDQTDDDIIDPFDGSKISVRRPPRSALSEIASQLKAGVVSELPGTIGRAAQYATDPGNPVYEWGKQVANEAEARGRLPEYAPQPEQHNVVTNALAGGARMIPSSVAIPAAAGLAAAALPVSTPVALGLGAIAGAVPFGMAQAQQTLDKAREQGIPDEVALPAARQTGTIEAGGEALGNLVGYKLMGAMFKPMASQAALAAAEKFGQEAAAALSPAARNAALMAQQAALREAAEATAKEGIVKPWAKALGQAAIVEPATEVGQQYGEAAVEQAAGISKEDPWQSAKEVIAPTLGMTALLAPFGLAGHAVARNRAQRYLADRLAEAPQPAAEPPSGLLPAPGVLIPTNESLAARAAREAQADEHAAGVYANRAAFEKERDAQTLEQSGPIGGIAAAAVRNDAVLGVPTPPQAEPDLNAQEENPASPYLGTPTPPVVDRQGERIRADQEEQMMLEQRQAQIDAERGQIRNDSLLPAQEYNAATDAALERANPTQPGAMALALRAAGVTPERVAPLGTPTRPGPEFDLDQQPVNVPSKTLGVPTRPAEQPAFEQEVNDAIPQRGAEGVGAYPGGNQGARGQEEGGGVGRGEQGAQPAGVREAQGGQLGLAGEAGQQAQVAPTTTPATPAPQATQTPTAPAAPKSIGKIPVLGKSLLDYKTNPEAFVDDLIDHLGEEGDFAIGLRGPYSAEMGKSKLRASTDGIVGESSKRLPGVAVVGITSNYDQASRNDLKSSLQEALRHIGRYGDNEYVSLVVGKPAGNSDNNFANDPGEMVIRGGKVVAYIRRNAQVEVAPSPATAPAVMPQATAVPTAPAAPAVAPTAQAQAPLQDRDAKHRELVDQHNALVDQYKAAQAAGNTSAMRGIAAQIAPLRQQIEIDRMAPIAESVRAMRQEQARETAAKATQVQTALTAAPLGSVIDKRNQAGERWHKTGDDSWVNLDNDQRHQRTLTTAQVASFTQQYNLDQLAQPQEVNRGPEAAQTVAQQAQQQEAPATVPAAVDRRAAERLVTDAVAQHSPDLLKPVQEGIAKGRIVVGENSDQMLDLLAQARGQSVDDILKSANETRDSLRGTTNGFYDRQTKTAYLVADALRGATPEETRRKVMGVLYHETTHGRDRAALNQRALNLIDSRDDGTHTPMARVVFAEVARRMEAAGNKGDAREAMPYLVEVAAQTGRFNGSSRVDGRFLMTIDRISKPLGKLIRDWVASFRAAMLKRGMDIKPTVDDLVAVARSNVRDFGNEGALKSEQGVQLSSRKTPAAPNGEWGVNADRLVPRGKVEWTVGAGAASGMVGGKPVATLRKVTGGWVAGVPGWQWNVTPDMGVARFNQISGDKIRQTPRKSFPTLAAAKAEVESILAPHEVDGQFSREQKTDATVPTWARGLNLARNQTVRLSEQVGDAPAGSYQIVPTVKEAYLTNMVTGEKVRVPQADIERAVSKGLLEPFVEPQFSRGDMVTLEPKIPEGERVSPMASAVQKDGRTGAQGRLSRALARAAEIGSPQNERTELTAGDKTIVVGKITPQDWVDRVNRTLKTKAEITQAREWYGKLRSLMARFFGEENADKMSLTWLMSQQNTSPSGGMLNVLRASDIVSGLPEIKKAGLGHDRLLALLRGQIPEKGYDAKLLDFVDSELHKTTRTVMGDDPRGGSPAVIDVWANRDVGKVDGTLKTWLEKTFGKAATEGVKVDGDGITETDYEYGVRFYNDLVKELNKSRFDGGGWNTWETQAVGWVAMQEQMGIKAEHPEDLFDKNTRRVSIGLEGAKGSSLEGKQIDPAEAKTLIEQAAKATNVIIRSITLNQGAYLGAPEASYQVDILGSPESMQDFAAVIGHGLRQTEVIISRALASGSAQGVTITQVGGQELADPKLAEEFAKAVRARLRRLMPTRGGISAPNYTPIPTIGDGYQGITVDGQPGIRLLHGAWSDKEGRVVWGGKWDKAELGAFQQAIAEVASEKGYDLTADIDQYDVVSEHHDWRAGQAGNGYRQSLLDRGRNVLAERLGRDEFRLLSDPGRQATEGLASPAGAIQFSRGSSPRTVASEDEARAQGYTLKAYRGVDRANPYNDTGTAWLTTSRDVAEAYAEEVFGYRNPGVETVMVKPDGLPRHDMRKVSGEQLAALEPDEFGNPQKVGIYDNSDDSNLGSGYRHTVIHAPKDAVVRVGNANNPDIRFSLSTPPAQWRSPAESKLADFLYTWTDKHIDTADVIKQIEKVRGKVRDDLDVRLQETTYSGKAAKATSDFLHDSVTPLLKEMEQRKVTQDELNTYLHNRHAEERNIQIAKVNKAFQDGGSGIDTKDARAYLSGLTPERKAAYEAIAKRVDAITAGTRKALVDYGLEGQKTIDAWQAAYPKYYVPLMREEQPESMGIGQGFSVKGSASKRAMGSMLPVDNILANVVLQRERTITRGEKAPIARALFGLALENPNPDFWTLTPPTMRYVDKTTGQVESGVDPLYKNRDNVVVARFPDGQGGVVERAVVFNESDERAKRMALALKNLDADDLGTFLGIAAKATRFVAAMATQYNPMFGPVNLTRDVQTAMLNLSSTELAGKQADVVKLVPSAIKGIYRDLRAVRRGQHPKSRWAALFEDFQRAGGQTGYRDMFKTAADRARALEHELNPTAWMDSAFGKVFTVNGILKVPLAEAQKRGGVLFDWLSDYNETLENAVRLSAYKVGIDNGMSKARAATLAKELTVNFNRKGQIATQAGSLYAFFNAAAQGTARIAKTLAGPAGKKIIYGGLTLGAMQALALAAAGFDDDEPPEFVRQRSLIIPIGDKKYVTIPMPLGFHVIPNIGRIATEIALKGGKGGLEKGAGLLGVILDAFNPVGSSTVLQTITPTVVDPIAALAENKDWTGKPIAKLDRSGTNPTPGHTRAKDSSSVVGKMASEAINYVSGGDKYVPGILSPTPDQIDYLIGAVTGGVGREILKVFQTGNAMVTGEDLPTYKIPLVGRFYGDADQPSAQSSAFYKNITKLNKHEEAIKGRQKDRISPAEYIAEHPEARYWMLGNQAERTVQKLNKRKRELIAQDAPKEQIKAVDDQITMVMKRLNDRMREVTVGQ